MRNAKTIIIGIACAMALAYIISGIYDKAVGGDNTDGLAKSGRNVCIYDNGEYSLVDKIYGIAAQEEMGRRVLRDNEKGEEGGVCDRWTGYEIRWRGNTSGVSYDKYRAYCECTGNIWA